MTDSQDGDDKPFWPTWLKLLWVSFVCAIFVVPLFYVIFYSYFAHRDANDLLVQVLRVWNWPPLLYGLVIFVWIVALIGLVAKYGYGRRL